MPAHGTALANRRDIVPLCCWFLSGSRGTSAGSTSSVVVNNLIAHLPNLPRRGDCSNENLQLLLSHCRVSPAPPRDAGVYDRQQGGCNAEDGLETPGVPASTHTSCTARGESRAEGHQTKTGCKTLLLVVSFLIRQKLP